jgi:hypothetical protein
LFLLFSDQFCSLFRVSAEQGYVPAYSAYARTLYLQQNLADCELWLERGILHHDPKSNYYRSVLRYGFAIVFALSVNSFFSKLTPTVDPAQRQQCLEEA